jgi:hypothetical protein
MLKKYLQEVTRGSCGKSVEKVVRSVFFVGARTASPMYRKSLSIEHAEAVLSFARIKSRENMLRYFGQVVDFAAMNFFC